MSVLVVGAGYLGGEIINRLLASGEQVFSWVRSEASVGRLLSAGVFAEACEISSREVVVIAKQRLPEPPGVIICCVTTPHGAGEDAYVATYLQGARNLTAHFPGARVVFISSTSVYGQTNGETVDETSPTQPVAATSRVLLEAEHVVLEAGGTVARLAGLYGPNRSVLLCKFLEGTARIEDGGGRVLNQIHRDDAAAAIVLLAQAPHSTQGIFNVVDDTPMTQREFYQRLADILGASMPPEGPRDPGKRRGWTSKRVSNAKLRALGWQPQATSWFTAFHRGDFQDLIAASTHK